MGRLKRIRESDESGLTLIEILAALVILGIVFIGFMSIFPQMTTFNKVTETKLKTMNIAKQEMADIQSNLFADPFNDAEVRSVIEVGRENLLPGTSPVDGVIAFHYEKDGYSFESEFLEAPELKGDEDAEAIALHQVQLKVIVDGKVNSETYGYVKVKGGD